MKDCIDVSVTNKGLSTFIPMLNSKKKGNGAHDKANKLYQSLTHNKGTIVFAHYDKIA